MYGIVRAIHEVNDVQHYIPYMDGVGVFPLHGQSYSTLSS